MSVIALSPRPHRPGRTDPVPPRAVPTLTVTLDLGAGTLSPGLARLVELLGELAEAGVLHQEIRTAVRSGADRAPAGSAAGPVGPPAPGPPSLVEPDAPDVVRILAGSRMVRRGVQEIPLTRIEYDLLLFLAEHPRRVFTRRQLLASVWGYEHAVARTVDVHVRRLRAKLAGTPVVTTVYGVGYRLADEAPVVVDPER